MPKTGPNWALITTYKLTDKKANKFRFMETFINYYFQTWGIQNFVILIGVVDGVDFQPIQKRLDDLSKFLGTYIQIVRYPAERSVHTSEWTRTKLNLFTMVNRSVLSSKIDKILNIDCDEFIRIESSNIDLNKEKQLHCHMVDYVPSRQFRFLDNMHWCVQPFYYRVKQGAITGRNQHQTNGSIQHGCCKIYYFDRSKILNPWIHSNNIDGDICKTVDSSPNPGEIAGVLQLNYMCYHLAVLDEMFFLKSKSVEFVESQTDPTYNQDTKELKRIFNDYYLNVDYPVFVDNFLKKYWRKENG